MSSCTALWINNYVWQSNVKISLIHCMILQCQHPKACSASIPKLAVPASQSLQCQHPKACSASIPKLAVPASQSLQCQHPKACSASIPKLAVPASSAKLRNGKVNTFVGNNHFPGDGSLHTVLWSPIVYTL